MMSSRTNMNGEHDSHHHQHQQHHPPPHRHLPPPPHRTNSHNYYPNNYNSHGESGSGSSSSASFKGCCCCLFLLLTFLGLLVLAVVLVILLAVKPKKPQFELQQVGVQYVGITAAPPTVGGPAGAASITPSASLSFSIKMVFTAANPNKVGIKYSSTTFDVMYKGVPLGRASVPGFYQPAHSVRQVETTVGVDRVNLLQTEATNLVKDASMYDRVELRITGDVGAKIRVLDFTSPRVQVSVDCAIVISPRKQSLTYKQCGVDGVTV